MSGVSFREYSSPYIRRMWVDWPGMGLPIFSNPCFGPIEPGPFFGLLWRDTGVARTPLFFWAGEWNTWPVSLSLSVAPQPLCTDCVGKVYNYSCSGLLFPRVCLDTD